MTRTLSMEALPPFRLDLTAAALRRRPDNAVDMWDGHVYRRALTLEGGTIDVAVVQMERSAAPQLTVTLAGAVLDQQTEEAARAALARLLGLELDLSPFYRHAEGDPLLHSLAQRFRGLKPPRFPTLFECLVNAIACQQLTITVGIRLLNRLADAYGAASGEGTRAFPLPAQLAGLAPEALKSLGFSRAKAHSIVELAAGITAGTFDPAASRRSTTALHSPRFYGYEGSVAGQPSTPCCAGSDGCMSSLGTTSAPATTSRAGSTAASRSTTPAFRQLSAPGSRSPGSSTSTSCSPTSPSTAC